MICPNCGAEFREGITECNDCQVPLVPEVRALPEPPHDAEPVVLATYMSLPEARVAAGSLRAAGYRVWLWHDRVSSLNWGWMPAVGGVRLAVSSVDSEEAARFLADEEAVPRDPLVLSDSHPIRQRLLWTRIITVLLVLPFFLPIAVLIAMIALTDFAFGSTRLRLRSRPQVGAATEALPKDPDD